LRTDSSGISSKELSDTTELAGEKCAAAFWTDDGGSGNEQRRIFVVAVFRGLGVHGPALAPDRHTADSHWASTKTRVSDPETAGLGQMGLG